MSIIFPLCHIFNQSIYEGSFPELMKKAEVIPCYKGKEMDYMINYRPISLLITISKLLEKIIYNRLHPFLDKSGSLFQNQYGFYSSHSCEQAILELIGHILQSKNRNEHSTSFFLNLLKAFGTLDHNIMIAKLGYEVWPYAGLRIT